ncbi:OmpA family protein [Cetobacterium sp.]|uniref:OmpA family protein n=1 Tax=Cetobacterium sp. TaxID=2071632 RepID=UPI003AF1BBC8
MERAREVQKFLIEKGVSSEKIYVEGHSKQYLNSNSSLLEKAQNRRVEIKII